MTETAAAWRLQSFESLASTSDLCRTLAASGEPDGLAVLAQRQTAGRGSRGRGWLSEPGNLFLSILLRPADRPRDAGLWALLAGVAVADALARPGIALKWPNDILLDGAKLGGILLETAVNAQGQLDWLVIGIGINLASAPDIAGRQIAALGTQSSPEHLAQNILAGLAQWRSVRQTEGWGAIRTAWLDRALPVGSLMTLRQGDRHVAGAFAGLADDGSLLLQTDGAVQAFASGEIWLPKEPENDAC